MLQNPKKLALLCGKIPSSAVCAMERWLEWVFLSRSSSFPLFLPACRYGGSFVVGLLLLWQSSHHMKMDNGRRRKTHANRIFTACKMRENLQVIVASTFATTFRII